MVIFLLNAISGRTLVLPGYLSSLESGMGSVLAVREAFPLWKVIRYLIWTYSFKLGIFLIGTGTRPGTMVSRDDAAFLIGLYS